MADKFNDPKSDKMVPLINTKLGGVFDQSALCVSPCFRDGMSHFDARVNPGNRASISTGEYKLHNIAPAYNNLSSTFRISY
jgi:hypothetical protein